MMGSLEVRFALALVSLLAGVVIAALAWPQLAASLTLSASVTAWVHPVVAPIAGRTANDVPPGSRIGSDGTIMEIVNDRLDDAPLREAERVLERVQARVAAASQRLEALRLADRDRRELMQRTALPDRARDLKSENGKAAMELGTARAAEREALQALGAQRQAYRSAQKVAVTAPPGATIYSIVPAGAAVEAGDPIARWLDCDELLVDAPVFDPWLRLLSVGGRGQVMLEAESFWRYAEIVALRRAAEVVGARELAVIAKGRDRGLGQVLLRLAATSADFDRCPVGRAVYVRLPDLDLLARLGL
ncbi:MAG: hypothetical protein KIS73_04285 [Enhydrobacter sp.]|nr:hypothetical protein [Enhydrobacter sp.]